jgi:two-component system response regulator GlrR
LGFGIVPTPKKNDPDPSGQPQTSKRKVKVLVVDQDAGLRRVLTARLDAADYAVTTVDAAQAALDACVRSRPNLVISELRLEDMDGLALLKEIKSRWPQITVIILTTHASIPEAVQATQAGAFSFLVKPVGKQELLGHVERATAASSFLLTARDWQEEIMLRSRLMEERLAIANRAAASTVPLLLTSPSGTGKELFARAIHAASMRRGKPFVAVSCRSRSGAELELELFGDTRGGETTGRPGAFASARGGTLLLDEVGELPSGLQLALAAAMPSRTDSAASLPVRLICTTSRDLAAAAATGQFLRELLDQISTLPIEMPPLGRRREDLPLLISHFLEQATDPGSQDKIYTPQAIERLATNDWPAKVKRLFDLVKQNVALTHGEAAVPEILQEPTAQDPDQIPTYDEAREAFARAYLADNLKRTGGNVTKAARIAKRTRTDFYKLLARYRLNPEDFKESSGGRRRK